MGRVKPSGEIEIDVMAGAVTATVTDCETVPSVAEMDEVPTATPVTAPEASTVAMAVEEELQVTSEVRSALLPSL